MAPVRLCTRCKLAAESATYNISTYLTRFYFVCDTIIFTHLSCCCPLVEKFIRVHGDDSVVYKKQKNKKKKAFSGSLCIMLTRSALYCFVLYLRRVFAEAAATTAAVKQSCCFRYFFRVCFHRRHSASAELLLFYSNVLWAEYFVFPFLDTVRR